jgi:hypothetical protein
MPSFMDERKVFKVWNDGGIVARGEAAAPHFLTSEFIFWDIFLKIVFKLRRWKLFSIIKRGLVASCTRVSDST